MDANQTDRGRNPDETSDALDTAGEMQAPTAETGPTVASLTRELAELNDRYLRLAADYQNYARRAEQKSGEAREQQTMDIARALVPVLDHFERALNIDAQSAAMPSVLAGVQMVQDELNRVMERFGVKRIDVQPGEELDPRRHEALMRQPAVNVPTNHVVAQLQPGYALGEKTIRPAKVSVAE